MWLQLLGQLGQEQESLALALLGLALQEPALQEPAQVLLVLPLRKA
jgi:hypothetical protein